MDLHPTPFPGKVPPANSIKKDGGDGENKISKEASLVPARYRQKGVLGISKSANILVKTGEKPLSKPSIKTIRKPKPSEPLSKPSNKDFPMKETKSIRNHEIKAFCASPDTFKDKIKVEIKKKNVCFRELSVKSLAKNVKEDLACTTKSVGNHEIKAVCASPDTSKDKIKVEIKKNNVCFQEPPVKSLAQNVKEDLLCTPVSSIKPGAVSTPYQSAGNCSKCRFDRLESSSYWLTQIKMAESVGKHFVSAAFFRLALECSAEPFRSLLRELKRYVACHDSISKEAMWREVSHSYGLLNEGTETETGSLASALENAVSEEHGGCDLDKIVVLAEGDDELENSITNEKKPGILGDEDTDSMVISKTEPIKQAVGSTSELKDNCDEKEFGDAIEDVDNEAINNLKLDSSSKDTLSDDKNAFTPSGTKTPFDGRKGGKGEGNSVVGKRSFGKKNGGIARSHGGSSPSDDRKHKSDESVEKTGKNRAGARKSQSDRPMR